MHQAQRPQKLKSGINPELETSIRNLTRLNDAFGQVYVSHSTRKIW
uniref:Uncharacterized protein n=1 Tax=Anguilla anguilla TaxID=7936 RepID=A0A0E9V2I9_ANGAN